MQEEKKTRLTALDLNKIKERLGPLLLAEARANELVQQTPPARLFVAVCGVRVEFDSFEVLDDFLSLQKVTNPPGIVHVTRAADLRYSDYLAVSRYSSAIQEEIAVGNTELQENDQFLLGIAWHTAALLKLRGYTSLFCPSSSSASWDTISAISDNSIKFQMLDDISKQISFTPQEASISVKDLEWVKLYWNTALDLRNAEKSRRFGLAFTIMYAWNQTPDPRIAIANIWAGLEALFGQRNERRTTEALARRISAWLPSITENEVRNLYIQRCDAVHGRWLNDAEVGRALKESENLLRQALIKCIETNTRTLPDWR
jgi:hypothetical protein